MSINSSDSIVSLHEFDTPGQNQATKFQALLNQAKQGDTAALGKVLQRYVNYLNILVSTVLNSQLRRKVDPADVVQDAMLAARRDFLAFRGQSQSELLAWLREILILSLHRDFTRHMEAEKRAVRREVSLDAMTSRVEASAVNLASFLPDNTESPCATMRADEGAVELADRIFRLPTDYRDVIVYRLLQGLSFEEIAVRMKRSNGAVRMLWLQGLDAFRTQVVGTADEEPVTKK